MEKSNFSNNNLDAEEIKNYIRSKIEYAKVNGNDSFSLISGYVHKDLGLQNSMPRVCNAMKQIIKEYPGSKIEKPMTVSGENSSTIKYTYNITNNNI